MRTWVAAVSAALLLLAPGAVALQQPGVIRITDVRLWTRTVPAGTSQVFLLYNRALAPYHIGRAVLICSQIGVRKAGPYPETTRFCWGNYQIGDDSIEIAGVYTNESLWRIPVTGGTGRYSNVGGTLNVIRYAGKPVREQLVFRLTI